ncbi:MAG: MFS transporter, partial [Planctomycetaceae bacterium]|jgi:acyl-[acyl-carrier-protein]-phospholipid O-acyltransferase/long-chain-fatty-acid--[acyl-carrier-protein] ligase|nr:MFS transporter [Planctomycetaceae bacterium]
MSESTIEQKPQSLFNKGFIALLITQFTVAFNDNAFRWLLVPIGKCYADNDIIRLLGGVFLLIPFLLWTSVAGYVTDRFSRRRVMIWCKVVELILLLLAILIITMGPSIELNTANGFPLKIILLLAILFLLGSQSAFFSPSKYSVIPDLVPETSLSAANGYVAMLTMIACVSGQVVGGYVYFWTTNFSEKTTDGIKNIAAIGIPGAENIWVTAIVLLGIAFFGFVASLFIPRLKAVAPEAVFPRNPFMQTCRDLASLFSYKKLFWIAIASAFFWGLAALTTNNIDKFATEYLKVQQQYVTILIAILSIGIGLGALLCGFLSGKRIELGFVPIGAIGMGIMIFVLGFTPAYGKIIGDGMGNPFGMPYIFATLIMLLTGLFAGFYDVPLAAYIQQNSPKEKRGRTMAAYNFLSFSTMIVFLVAGMLGVIIFNTANNMKISNYDPSLLIWISIGVFTFLVGAVLLYYLWSNFLINVIRTILILIYRPKVIGLENIPQDGGYILASNHISLLDGLLITAIYHKKIRFIMYDPLVPNWFKPLERELGLIRLLTGKRAAFAVKTAREGLHNGDVIGIFPEGGITRNSQMRQFEAGFLSILKGDPTAPVVPVYIHGLFGSMFSYKYGDKIKFLPRILPTGIVIAFGKPIYNPENTSQIQHAVQELGAEVCVEPNCKRHPIPAKMLIKTCKSRKFTTLFSEHNCNEHTISGGKFLELVLLLRCCFLREKIFDKQNEEPNIGILMPVSIKSAIANATITIMRKVAVNLDCNSDAETLNKIIHDAKIKHILSSREFENNFKNINKQIDAEIIFIEDILDKLTLYTRLLSKFGAFICPQKILTLLLGLSGRKHYNNIATIIYNNTNTTDTTNSPLGVVLTNSNLTEAVRGFVDAMRLNKNDVILGSAPLTNSLGYAGVFWTTFFSGSASLLCEFDNLISVTKNPSDQSNDLLSKTSLSMSDSNLSNVKFYNVRKPIFLRDITNWVADFKELDQFISADVADGLGIDFERLCLVCNVGSEGVGEVVQDISDKWQNKFGTRPATSFFVPEATLFVSANVPDCRKIDDFFIYNKDGSVGRPIAGVAIKIINPETGKNTKPNETGTILIKSPTTMKTYNNSPELTSIVLQNGWLHTKIKGKIDESGFLWLS